MAAHPDDENTRLIAWLENEKHIETAYLSLTRGQGGQNLIGDEKGDGLGVIRTYELLEARKVDGGEQMFTRAVDFGYSKSAEESFEIWGKEQVLEDVVYAIRKFRPHVIITRFPPNRYAGHGHHEASAILAEEAFDLAADESAFPEQLGAVQTWQPTSLYFNTSSCWRKELAEKSVQELAEEKIHKVNIGVFDPMTGKAVNEIASIARSKHRCQAFGTLRDRGERWEFLQHVKGEDDPHWFEHHPGHWPEGSQQKAALEEVISAYDFTSHSANLDLMKKSVLPAISLRSLWASPADIALITEAVNQINGAMNGVRVEVYAGQEPILVGSEFEVSIEVYNSSERTKTVSFRHPSLDTTVEVLAGQRIEWQSTFTAPMDASCPYWLRSPHGSLYVNPNPTFKTMARDPAMEVSYQVQSDVMFNGASVVHRKWRDRSIGEITQPLAFVQPVSLLSLPTAVVQRVGDQQTLEVVLKANTDVKAIQLQVEANGWNVTFDKSERSMSAGQVLSIPLNISSDVNAALSQLKLRVICDGLPVSDQLQLISYDHIPEVHVHKPAEVALVPIQMETNAKRVLYIEGSGDEVDESLIRMGVEVDYANFQKLSMEQLRNYDAVLTGIRAFNKNEELAANTSLLLDYVEQGGNLVVMYNTTYDLKVSQFAPDSLMLSRNRVTDELAIPTMLDPKHPVFNRPNQLSEADFDGWVQERGLYFAGSWGPTFKPLIAWHDKGEEDHLGGLLVAEHGKGTFVYTGISFFRQLPAGVPGAYRLLANILSL